MDHYTTDVPNDIDTDRFETCPVSGRSFDATDPDDFNIVTLGSASAQDGIKVASDVAFTDVIDELRMVDVEIADPDVSISETVTRTEE